MIRTRNTVLGISGQSKRHMIHGAYDANMEALTAILTSSRTRRSRAGLRCTPSGTMPSPPILPPNTTLAASKLKSWPKRTATVFADLDDAVPSEYYGVHNFRVFSRASQPDFFHFRKRLIAGWRRPWANWSRRESFRS